MTSRRSNVDERRRAVAIFRLGEEPTDDLSDTTTAEQRIEMVRELTERAWRLSGRSLPSYSRKTIPVRVTRLGD